MSVEVRTLDALEQPVALPVRIAGATGSAPCGAGCTRVALARSPAALAV